jgi:hypothetical protein
MYTGTLMTDLLAAVQVAEQTARRRQAELDQELYEIFSMQIPISDGDQLLMGAA